jgi:hypothetical protein
VFFCNILFKGKVLAAPSSGFRDQKFSQILHSLTCIMVSSSDVALVVTSAAAVDVVVLGVVVGTVVSAVLAVGVGVVTGNRSRPPASSSPSSNKSSLKHRS